MSRYLTPFSPFCRGRVYIYAPIWAVLRVLFLTMFHPSRVKCQIIPYSMGLWEMPQKGVIFDPHLGSFSAAARYRIWTIFTRNTGIWDMAFRGCLYIGIYGISRNRCNIEVQKWCIIVTYLHPNIPLFGVVMQHPYVLTAYTTYTRYNQPMYITLNTPYPAPVIPPYGGTWVPCI